MDDPCSCAASSASAIWRAMRQRLVERQRLRARSHASLASVGPVDQLHDERLTSACRR